MKRSLSFLLLGISTSFVNAQNVFQKSVEIRTSENLVSPPAPVNQTPDITTNTVLFSENFASGIPSTWVNQGFNGNTGLAEPLQRWEYRGPNTTPNNTVGSRGAYGSAGALNSPTSANGFVLFDSDWLDNNGLTNNFGNGQSATPHRARLETPSFSTVGSNFITLKFYQYYRRFAGPTSQTVPATYLVFSTNGGTTWGDTITLNTNIAVNSATGTSSVANGSQATLVNLPVGALIGNQANVKIQFLFHGDYYVWMLDDIEVAVSPNNDLKLDSAEVLSVVGGRSELYYPTMPIGQNGVQNYHFRARITNNGAVTQPNARFNVTISTGGNVVYSQNSASVNIAPGAVEFGIITAPFIPIITGITNLTAFSIRFTPISDSTLTNLGDDTTLVTFRIRDSVYAIENGVLSRALGSNFSIIFGVGGTVGLNDETFIANDFRVFNADSLTSVYIRTINTSRPGTLYRILVMDTSVLNESNSQGFASKIRLRSDFQQFTAADSIAQSVTVKINSFYDNNGTLVPQNNFLTPNRYLIGVQYFNILGSDTIIFGTYEDQSVLRNNDSLPFFASWIFNPNFPSGNNWVAGLSGRFFNGFVIRPHFGRNPPLIAINDAAVVAMLSPTINSNDVSPLGVPIPVRIRITNTGNQVIPSGFYAEYSVNGDTTSQIVNQNIPVGGAINFTFSSPWIPTIGGTNIVCGYLRKGSILGDDNTSNDTTCITLLQVNTEKLESSAGIVSNVFPNPANDKVNFEISSDITEGILIIYNQLGQAIANINLNDLTEGNLITIETNNYATGIYTFSLSNGQKLQTGKFVITR